MPLHFPDHNKLENLDAHGVNLRLVDEVGSVVQLYVHIGAMHRFGNAAGIDGNVIEKDLLGYLHQLLESILAEASQYYDAWPEPKPKTLEIDPRWLKGGLSHEADRGRESSRLDR
jgi:hypothetical protein